MESTLSGLTYLRYLKKAKKVGFEIHLHFLALPGADESWARVQSRAQEGGHAVPKNAVYRRFPRIKNNLLEHYLPTADRWNVWDASELPIEFVGDSTTITLSHLRKIL